MTLDEFTKWRDGLRATRAELTDCSELNLYRSLAFEPIAPSTHAEAPYRCHLAERFLAHLQLPESIKPRAQVSHGVRRSLAALFGWLARKKLRVGVPSDVYPVYLQLAAEAGATVVTWSARLGLPQLDTVDALLVCEPLKPWGRGLTPAETDQLAAWAKNNVLIIDSAYATPPTASTLRLLRDDLAFVLCSLSKGWLIPDHAGLCVAPSRFQQEAREAFAALPKDEPKVRIGYAALTEHSDRPKRVAAVLAERASRLNELLVARPELRAAPVTAGYFTLSQLPVATLLGEHRVLAAPATLFGGPSELSILSTLALR